MKHKTKFSPRAVQNAILGALLGASLLGWLVLRYLLPQYYFSAYFVIPVTFVVFVVVFLWLVSCWKQQLQAGKITFHHIFNYFMMWKMGKLLLSIVLIFGYMKLDGTQFKVFVVVFAVFYLIFMALEPLVLHSMEQEYRGLKS